MANSSMNIRMDSEVKEQAQRLFAEFGLDMTTAINMFLRQSIRMQGIPFDLKLEVPNAETAAAIEEVQKMKRDHNKKTYSSFSELLQEVKADV